MASISFLVAFCLLAISNVVAVGPAAVNLGSAGTFAILAKSGVSTVPASKITGNVGISPAASTFLTGFALTNLGPLATSTQVTGELLAANFQSPTPATLSTAVLNMGTAFADASGRVNPDHTNLASGILSGLTLAPGLYKWTTAVSIPTAIIISGLPTDTWIFQVASTLTMAANVKITLAGGALASNIVWVVTGSTIFGAGAHFEGILLGGTSATLDTGATMNGRLLVQTAVALQTATVTEPPTVL